MDEMRESERKSEGGMNEDVWGRIGNEMGFCGFLFGMCD
jgi:hypothetical protein